MSFDYSKKTSILFLPDIFLSDEYKINKTKVEVKDALDNSDIKLSFLQNCDLKMFEKSGIYIKLPKIFSTIEEWPKTTNLFCWYCDKQFKTIPIFIPTNVAKINEVHKINTKGCFCSFSCASSFIEFNTDPCEKTNQEIMLRYIFKIFNVGKPYEVNKKNKYLHPRYAGE